jgi:hypothetical protein
MIAYLTVLLATFCDCERTRSGFTGIYQGVSLLIQLMYRDIVITFTREKEYILTYSR